MLIVPELLSLKSMILKVLVGEFDSKNRVVTYPWCSVFISTYPSAGEIALNPLLIKTVVNTHTYATYKSTTFRYIQDRCRYCIKSRLHVLNVLVQQLAAELSPISAYHIWRMHAPECSSIYDKSIFFFMQIFSPFCRCKILYDADWIPASYVYNRMVKSADSALLTGQSVHHLIKRKQ